MNNFVLKFLSLPYKQIISRKSLSLVEINNCFQLRCKFDNKRTNLIPIFAIKFLDWAFLRHQKEEEIFSFCCIPSSNDFFLWISLLELNLTYSNLASPLLLNILIFENVPIIFSTPCIQWTIDHELLVFVDESILML